MTVSEHGVARPTRVARVGEFNRVARLGASSVVPALVVGLLTFVGLALRLAVAGQSLFADEVSTYWIISAHDLGGTISTVHSDAEITPPLYFLASWLTRQISDTPEFVRAPSLLAGIATIPLVYLLGLRTVGRAAAAAAAALTAFSPFMVYYSTEARGYALMMCLVTLSTLAMLVALDTRRARWWVVYAVASCGAMYTHYTCAFALGAQLLWLVWARPEARRPAVLANLGALVAFLPWTSGVLADLNSPTGKILSALSPFNTGTVRNALEHWSIGFPYSPKASLTDMPGAPALVLLLLAVVLAIGGMTARARRHHVLGTLRGVDPRVLLVVVLTLSVPVGEALVSAFSTQLFGIRNLAASWPAFSLAFALLLVAAGPRLRFVAVGLAVVSFALGGTKLLSKRFERPGYRAAAAFVDSAATPRDVLIDQTAAPSPGPLSNLDAALRRPHRIVRVDGREERDHPFSLADRVVLAPEAIRRAVAAAKGARILVISYRDGLAVPAPPAPYRLEETRAYPGFVRLEVRVYSVPASSRV